MVAAAAFVVIAVVIMSRCSGGPEGSAPPAVPSVPPTAPTVTVTVPPDDDTGTNHDAAVPIGVPQWELLFGTDMTLGDVYQVISDPESSDLDPGTWASATSAAQDVAVAELTGRGRRQWAAYWGLESADGIDTASPPQEAAYGDVEILAAGASSGPVDGVVRALVVWDGAPDDPFVPVPEPGSRLTLLLRQDPEAPSGWAPVHSWDL